MAPFMGPIVPRPMQRVNRRLRADACAERCRQHRPRRPSGRRGHFQAARELDSQTMDFGIVTAKVDEIGFITHAENLGYSHCWVTDSPMIRSNCWAVLALAAQ